MIETCDGLCALVNKQGACYQCNVLRDAAPPRRRGEPVQPIGQDSQTAAERLKLRLQIAREAQLETGHSRLLHAVIFRLMSRMFDGAAAPRLPEPAALIPDGKETCGEAG